LGSLNWFLPSLTTEVKQEQYREQHGHANHQNDNNQNEQLTDVPGDGFGEEPAEGR
jgi:hypothetical protein